MPLNLPSPLLVLLIPGISHSRHSHMQKGVKTRETQEREEPVLETWRGFGACSILRTSDGEVVKEPRGATVCGS